MRTAQHRWFDVVWEKGREERERQREAKTLRWIWVHLFGAVEPTLSFLVTVLRLGSSCCHPSQRPAGVSPALLLVGLLSGSSLNRTREGSILLRRLHSCVNSDFVTCR